MDLRLFLHRFGSNTLATGFLIVNGPPAWKDGLENMHELSLYYILPFIIIHFAGILLAEYGPQKGIISRIIGR